MMAARLRLMQYHADPGDAGRIRGEDSGGVTILRAKVYGGDEEERDLYGRAMAEVALMVELLEEWVGTTEPWAWPPSPRLAEETRDLLLKVRKEVE